jgi:hypothetical protein
VPKGSYVPRFVPVSGPDAARKRREL